MSSVVLSYCHSSTQEDCHKLTDQQQALNQGQNPLPIYLSLNVKDKISDQDFRGNSAPELHLTFNPNWVNLGLDKDINSMYKYSERLIYLRGEI